MNTVLTVLILIGAFILSLRYAAWKTKKACEYIILDLKQQNAFDPASAVELPYSKTSLFHIGMRDYRPRALAALVKFDHVRMQEQGRYYLPDCHKLQDPG